MPHIWIKSGCAYSCNTQHKMSISSLTSCKHGWVFFHLAVSDSVTLRVSNKFRSINSNVCCSGNSLLYLHVVLQVGNYTYCGYANTGNV